MSRMPSQAEMNKFRARAEEDLHTVSNQKSSRRIVSAEYAADNNLNHGRHWICNELNVETQGVSPELEGSLICYVYSN